jgi:hypothetical protein
MRDEREERPEETPRSARLRRTLDDWHARGARPDEQRKAQQRRKGKR